MLFFKSICYFNLGELMQARKTDTKLLQKSQQSHNFLNALDAIFILLKISLMFESLDEIQRLITQWEIFLEYKLDFKSKGYLRRRANFLYL